MLAIPAFGRQRLEYQELKVSLGYISLSEPPLAPVKNLKRSTNKVK